MNSSATDSGALERWGRLALKPHLRIAHKGERRIETVSVKYRVEKHPQSEFAGSLAYVVATTGVSSVVGNSRYIRAWVFNDWGFAARNCQVYVQGIWVNGRLMDLERSPLHWTDSDDNAYSLPLMRRGYDNGHYIDVCASDSVDGRFQVISQGRTKGHHKFHETGSYRLELSAEAIKPCAFSRMVLTVRHDQDHWDGLQVVSAHEIRS